ncbi:hypothetical protein BJV78DRAFT_1157817 [Lactifluus subvellereus]|nr:hypothetical protein BJV78DRAFT_1157817 [Lactifluus subvellereus]
MRERRYAEETLHIVKTISDRARDAEFSGVSHQTLDKQLQRTIDIAEATYQCYLSCKDAFSTPEQESCWVKSVACAAGPRFRAGARAKITPLVERFYEFETGGVAEGLDRNTERARDLKTDLAFINGENGLPYLHPIVQPAINVIWFGGRRTFHNEFHKTRPGYPH